MRRFSHCLIAGVAAFAGLCVLGCAAPRGGWDLAALSDRTPALERFAGHRLGDLVPFPQLEGDRVRLVVCRFSPGAPVAVRGVSEVPAVSGGVPRGVPRAALGQRVKQIPAATKALSVRVPGLELRWMEYVPGDGANEGQGAGPEDALLEMPSIWIESATSGPGGGGRIRGRGALGDTQSECDVAAGANGAVRGTLLHAAIRMRSQAADNMGRSREATDAEWLGALMHELGHAAGFIGHVISGDALMVQEESALRRWGQRVLDGEASDASVALEVEPTLSALYALSPGYVLGERGLTAEAAEELRRLRALQRTRAAQGVTLEQVVSMAGDRDARIEWRYSDGSRLGVWFRDWAAGLRAGGVMEAELDLRTRRALVAAGL